jgi:hypothetical protein
MADLVRRQVAEIATPASNVTSLVVVRSQPHWFCSRPHLRLYQTLKRAKAVPPGDRSQWHQAELKPVTDRYLASLSARFANARATYDKLIMLTGARN